MGVAMHTCHRNTWEARQEGHEFGLGLLRKCQVNLGYNKTISKISKRLTDFFQVGSQEEEVKGPLGSVVRSCQTDSVAFVFNIWPNS